MLQTLLQNVRPFPELNDLLDDALGRVPQVGQLGGSWGGVGAPWTSHGSICDRGCCTGGRVELLLAAVVVMMMEVRMGEILLGLVTGLVFAALEVPLHVLHLVQDLAVLLAQLGSLGLQLGQVLFAGLVVLWGRYEGRKRGN